MNRIFDSGIRLLLLVLMIIFAGLTFVHSFEFEILYKTKDIVSYYTILHFFQGNYWGKRTKDLILQDPYAMQKKKKASDAFLETLLSSFY